jgi:hypothetical protein
LSEFLESALYVPPIAPAVFEGLPVGSVDPPIGDASGFRPRRSAHQAIGRLWEGLMEMGGGYVIDVNIRRYFDTMAIDGFRRFVDRGCATGCWCVLSGSG